MSTPTNLAEIIVEGFRINQSWVDDRRAIFAINHLIAQHDREIIGSDEPVPDKDVFPLGYEGKSERNQLRAEQRQLAGLASQRALEGEK